MKAYLPYIIGFLLLVGLAMYVQSSSEKPVDWSPSYSEYDRIPYGNYILHELLPGVFPGETVQDDKQSAYMMESDSGYKGHNIIFPAQSFSPDEYDTKKLIELADSGNNLFIISPDFEGPFADTMKIGTGDSYNFVRDSAEARFSFFNTRSLPKTNYVYRNNLSGAYFTSFDTAKTVVLGRENDSNVNFIKIRQGKGAIYLHCAPVAFTNYYLIDKKCREYPFYCLSYLPKGPVIWNEYYLSSNEQSSSPLRYIFANEALRWAFWLIVCGLLFYMAFEMKRQQRIIPIIEPEKNTTLEFAETLGMLYYEKGDHKNIALKKIVYFYDFLRTRLYLRTDRIDDDFYKRFREKTGMSSEESARFFVNINRVRHLADVSEEDLLGLNKAIDDFYSRPLVRVFTNQDKKSFT